MESKCGIWGRGRGTPRATLGGLLGAPVGARGNVAGDFDDHVGPESGGGGMGEGGFGLGTFGLDGGCLNEFASQSVASGMG